MITLLLPVSDPDHILQALRVLDSGGLVAFPTDTVYGLGARAFDETAIASIYTAKDRPADKAIPVLLADAQDMHRVASSIPAMAARLAARFWPGPLTLVVPKNSALPRAVSATDTVGVRVPDHAAARALLRAAGPMAVTSANLSNHASPVTAQDVASQLRGRIDLILDGGRTPGGRPSTVVDCTGQQPVILREGPLSLDAILGEA